MVVSVILFFYLANCKSIFDIKGLRRHIVVNAMVQKNNIHTYHLNWRTKVIGSV